MEMSVVKRLTVVAGFLAMVGLLGALVYGYARGQALDQLARRGEADLALAADRLTGQLQRYKEETVLLASHPVLADGSPREKASEFLQNAADKVGALNLIFVKRSGEVAAAARRFADDDLAGGAWFKRAMQGALGAGQGQFGPDGRRAHVFAAPRFGDDGRQVTGALVAAVDLNSIEDDWPGSGPAVYFVDAGGRVLISNRSELLFWRHDPGGDALLPATDLRPARVSNVAGHRVWQIDWGAYLPSRAMYLTRDLPVIGMSAAALIDTATAENLAFWQATVFVALCLAFGALLFVATERRRTLAQANRMLEARVAARTAELSGANIALRREVEERQEAERALKRAQADLVQAGKLSALGQMSAGISHELNQPLMAIQQYAENGSAFIERGRTDAAGDNLGRISALAVRAGRIIRNLRAFARNESEPMGRVDLGGVIDAAVELTDVRLGRDGVTLIWQRPVGDLMAYGGDVRLTQVFVNLINNAADAMVDQSGEKTIEITVDQGAKLSVAVRDTGPGVTDMEKIFEPFYSTKEVGEGMGLGLSISYGLVQSFGGNIRGANYSRDDGPGGAVFTVELDRWQVSEQAGGEVA